MVMRKHLLRIFAAFQIIVTTSLVGTPAAMSEEISPAGAAARLAELREEFGNPDDRYIDLEGIEVVYRDEGTGPTILLIHGSASNLRSLDRLANALSEDFRVIRYDVPPFGLSGPVEHLDLSDVRPEDVPARLLGSLGVDKATIVGTSYGGSIALSLAANYPELVERLIISNAPSDPVPTAVDVGPSLKAALEKYGGPSDILRSRPAEFWQVWYEYYFGEPERILPEYADQTAAFTRPMPSRNVLSLIATVSDNEAVRERYAKVAGPVLLLWGGRDPMLPAPSAKTLESYLPSAQVSIIIMPDVGHYPLMEVPDRYAASVESYIRDVTPMKSKSPPPRER